MATVGSPSCARRNSSAAQARHLQIEQDETGDVRGAMPDRPQQVKRVEAVTRRDRVEAFSRDQLADHFADLWIVFDDEDVAG